jgi:MFS family permease
VLVLWTGQILAGIGAAAIFPTSLAMVASGTHTIGGRARSIAIWAALLSTGGAVSPVVGGLVAKLKFGSDANASWRWGFIVVLVIAVISAIISAVAARDSSAAAGRSLDWSGQVTIAIALFAMLFAVIQGPTTGWGSWQVIGAFVLAAVFIALFIGAEHRSRAPLLRLGLFANRAFTVSAVVTVVAMFGFLGTAYATSIRLSAIQGFSPLKSSIGFILLNGIALVEMPLTARLVEKLNPKWTLGGGAALIGIGDLWMAGIPAGDMSIGVIIAPLALVGVGFGFAVSSLTAVAVNAVPTRLTGMAAGATSMLRDFGFTLGPAVVGAIALSQATARINASLAASPALRKALAAFNAAPASAPAAQKPSLEAAVGAVSSGPLGANGVPATIKLPTGKTVPFNPLKDVAFHALSHAYSLGYVVVGIAALVSALLAVVAIGGRGAETLPEDEPEGERGVAQS